MDIVTLDWETYYADDYTLSSLTTEAYVRDPRFEPILCGFKINHEPGYWVKQEDIAYALRYAKVAQSAVLAHHAHFDGLIMFHHYGISPKLWFDTLGMARALYGQNGRLSLAALCKRWGIPDKGEEVMKVKNMRYRDFGPQALDRYGQYCVNDCERERDGFDIMAPHFSRDEFLLNDSVVRMFTEPRLVLDTQVLQAYADQLRADKIHHLIQAGVQLDDVMSNDKFAESLRQLGIEPPMKVSPTWVKDARPAYTPEDQGGKGPPKMTWAFAKGDAAMQELQEHDDERVQFLVEARLKNKTTIAEKGAMRLIGMSSRGKATVYLKYSGASGTHRLSGGDKFNWQAMKRGSPIRDAVMAPKGHQVIVVDSSTIEARLLDWLAGQDDMVQVYRDADMKVGPDMYCMIGGRIYQRTITKKDDPDERQMGKVAKLGLGYGMGADRFQVTVRGQAKDKDGKPLKIKRDFAEYVVGVYREAHPQVRKLWARGEAALDCISRGQAGVDVDFRGIVKTTKTGLIFPGGLRIEFPELTKIKVGERQFGNGSKPIYEYEFWNGKHRERLYGAKVIENIIQCLARIVVMWQCQMTAKEVKPVGGHWVHSMHDEGVFIAPDFEAPWVLERLMTNMRRSPAWAPGLPLNCEGGMHPRYGKAKA